MYLERFHIKTIFTRNGIAVYGVYFCNIIWTLVSY